MSPVTPREALAALVENEGQDAYWLLDKGIGTETDSGKRWLAARAALAAPEVPAVPASATGRAFHIGAQNDALFIIYGERPALNNDYPRHDADRTCVAKIYDEALARALVDAANRSSAPEAVATPSDAPACPQSIIDAITAYGDARADSNLDAGAAALGTAIRLIRAALAAAPTPSALQVLASSDPEAHRQAIVDSEAEMWMAYMSDGIKRAFTHEEDARRWLGSGIHRDGAGIVPLVVAPTQPAAQVPQWQPIESAPQDGSEILVFKPSVGIIVARWLDADHPDVEYIGLHEAWNHQPIERATHWTPLPAAPEAKP